MGTLSASGSSTVTVSLMDSGSDSKTSVGCSSSAAVSASGSDSAATSASRPSRKEMVSCCGSENSVSSGRPGWMDSPCSACTGSCGPATATVSAAGSYPMRDRPSAGFLSYETPTAMGVGQLRSLTFSCTRVESARNEMGPQVIGAGGSGAAGSANSG